MSDKLPLCYIEWPGLLNYFEAYMTIGHGIQPGTCVIVCPAQETPISPFGNLIWHSGNMKLQFPACRVDKVEASIDPDRGRIWIITILDRRWRWRFGSVQGWWNVREGNLALRETTVKSPRDLAKMYLKQMGETRYNVEDMPDVVRPEIRHDPGVVPAVALEQLCESLACRVVPFFERGVFTGVRIVRLGYGAALPKTTQEFYAGFDTAELPDKVGIRLAPTLIEVHLPLRAVISTDLFQGLQGSPGSILQPLQRQHLARLQQYADPEPGAFPRYDPTAIPKPWELWRDLPDILRDRLQMQVPANWFWFPVPQELPGAYQPNALPRNSAVWTQQMQTKLRDEALRCYQVRLPFTVPGIGEITRHDQYILETERCEQVEDPRTGVIRRAPAYVYGSFCVDVDRDMFRNLNNSEAEWGDVNTPIDPNNPLILQGDFAIDPEQRIVRFTDHMVRNTCPRNNYSWQQGNILVDRRRQIPNGVRDPDRPSQPPAQYYEPAAIVLVTAIRLLGPDRQQMRYEKLTDVAPRPERHNIDHQHLKPPINPLIAWSSHEDLELRGKVTYHTNAAPGEREAGDIEWPWFTTNALEWINKEACDSDMDYYLLTQMEKYQTKVPQRAVYPGLHPVQLDGAIEQITYSSTSTKGAFTVACRHSEWHFGMVVGYQQRRQLRELWSFQDIIRRNNVNDMREFRRWSFVPSSSGGHFTRKPPT